MTNVAAISLSGLAACAARISADVSQIAGTFAGGQNPPISSARQVQLQTAGGGFVPVSLSPSAVSVQESDLARSMVDMTEGREAYAANAAIIRINDAMTRTAIDVLGQTPSA